MEALFRLGQSTEAEARQQAFRRTYPSSTYRARLDRLRDAARD